MAHRKRKRAHARLVERLNRYPQGAPPSEYLSQILQILFSENEAELVSLLPIKPFTAQKAARIWHKQTSTASQILQDLADRGLMVDIHKQGRVFYVLPPPMAGFFEFVMMRVRHDIDQQELAHLFQQYLHSEDDFIKNLFAQGETQFGRSFVNESTLSESNALHVLDYERASEIIKTASYMAVSKCYCRHKMEHLGQVCDAPQEICMSFGDVAKSLVKHGHARAIDDRQEGLDLLVLAQEHDLVQFGENVQEEVSFLCNCCKCCCEALRAAREFASLNPIHTTNFLPQLEESQCSNCGQCIAVCPVNGIYTNEANRIQIEEAKCLGCGLCVKNCPTQALTLKTRPKRVLTPVNSAHRIVLMAVERGQLQDLIFDNKVLFSHRALATLLGAILNLAPVQQLLAQKQIKSHYLGYLIKNIEDKYYKFW